MQSKFIAASLAAAASAVSTTAQDTADVAATLIGYYENCQVSVDALVMNVETLNGVQKTTIDFDLSGIDENCPELEATVWLETPVDHVFHQDHDQAADMTVVMGNDELVNGHVEKQFQTLEFSGEYFAHVSISPFGFECAMAMVEECTSETFVYECRATFDNLETATMCYAEHTEHFFNWDSTDLWNCDLYAEITVFHDQDDHADDMAVLASKSMNWDTLYWFVAENDESINLDSATDFYDFHYRVEYKHEFDNSVYYSEDVIVENCNESCWLDTELALVSAEIHGGAIRVRQDYCISQSETCAIENVTAVLANMVRGNVSETEVTDFGGQNSADGCYTEVETWPAHPALVWDNFPIEVCSELVAEFSADKWGNQHVFELEATNGCAQVWPVCEFDILSIHTQEHSIVEGEQNKVHFPVSVDVMMGDYCSDFTGKYVLFHENLEVQTISVSQTDMGNSQTERLFENDFDAGLWCVKFELFHTGAREGFEQLIASETECWEVVTPACELTALTAFEGEIDHEAFDLELYWQSVYTASHWCRNEDLTFELWQYNIDTPEEVVVFEDYEREDLCAAGSIEIFDTIPECDYFKTSCFRVSHLNSLHPDQDFAEAEACASVEIPMTCRPSIELVELDTIKLDDESEYTLELNFQYKFGGTGLHNCEAMQGSYKLHSENGNYTYQAQSFTSEELEAGLIEVATITQYIDEVESCWFVNVHYGEISDSIDILLSDSSETQCHCPLCVLDASEPEWIFAEHDETRDNVHHYFHYYDTANKWCTDLSSTLTVETTDREVNGVWVAEEQTGEGYNAHVFQTSHFDSTEYLVTVDWQAGHICQDHEGFETVSKGAVMIWTIPENYCSAEVSTWMCVSDETLDTVTVTQSFEYTTSALCGPVEITADFQGESVVVSSDILYHEWTNVPSVDGTYHVDAHLSSGFHPSFMNHDQDDREWTRACVVEINGLEIFDFTEASYDNNTEAMIHLWVSATQAGSCGDDVVVEVNLFMGESEISVIELDQAAIFSAEGFSWTQDIHRDEACYSVEASVTAHGVMDGDDKNAFNECEDKVVSMITDSAINDSCFMGTRCNLAIEALEFEYMEEESNWEGQLFSYWTATVWAENSCENLYAVFTVYEEEYNFHMGFTRVEHHEIVLVDNYFTFTEVRVASDNVKHCFYAELLFSDEVAISEEVTMLGFQEDATVVCWAPPCYVYIDEFSKVGQSHNAAESQVWIDLSIKLRQEGDQACECPSANIAFEHSGHQTFFHEMSAEDIAIALYEPFEFQVMIDANSVSNAEAHFGDCRAADEYTDVIVDVFTPIPVGECHVEVMDFCLINMTPSAEEGRWDFEFTLEMHANPACQELHTQLDIVHDDMYLGGVSMDIANGIVDALDCDCEQTFVVTADFDGMSTGVFYGQLDVREPMADMIQITDSCNYEF